MFLLTFILICLVKFTRNKIFVCFINVPAGLSSLYISIHQAEFGFVTLTNSDSNSTGSVSLWADGARIGS